MSNSVDNRIVEMRFDNKQFESGVQTSIKSLDNLKSGLKLDESARSLSNLQKVGNSFSLAGISNGIEALNNKISTIGIIGITAIQNITNSAINAGKRMVSALTIDPIKMGFNEYETKMNSIQTILTNTASKGTTIDDVNKALNELNTYADKTIYNFSEMTRNIGTFTAAGIDLKTSSESIKGIANLAAGSGSSAQQASTAMYQLSQAMAAGTVKLMDWNSVVNAGMGGELFQKALEKTAKELGKGRDMSVSFRESLETGWITTEVMTKTLQKFANDPSLLQAATQVKTFTQMIDTMKESVQSGWAQTWETIIGNKDEAAKLFTSINDGFGSIIGSSADARNEMLSFWKANDGRAMAIQALTNSFNGLMYILKPIGDAFRDIFPAMTGKRLVEITQGIRDLTDNFKIGDATANNINRTFKGLFAVLDIGKQILTTLGSGLIDLLKNILPAGDGLLSITANIGDFLVALDNAIRTSGIFNVAMDKFNGAIKFIADGVKASIDTIIKIFEAFGDIDTSGIDSFSEKLKVRFEPLTILGNIVQGVFSKIANVLKTVAPVFYKLAEIVGNAFDNMRNNIVNALDNAEFNSVFDIINGGVFAAILLGLKKFIDSLTSITDSSGGFLKGVTGILDGVKGSLEAYQSSLKADTLLKIAISMGILAASLVALSLIDSDKLTLSLAAMTAMFVELFGSMAIFEKLMGSSGFASMTKITTSMILLSVAVLILSDAMTKLSKLDWEGITKGLIAVAGLSAILVKTADSISSNSKGLIKSSIGLILFAEAINILANAVIKIGAIDTASLVKGLVGVGVLCTELALFMKLTDLNGMGITKGIGLIALATALVILASAVKTLSSIDLASLTKGLTAIGVLLGEIVIFTKLTGDVKGITSTAIGLTILGTAMLIFANAIQKMGSLPLTQIGKGLITMAGALGIITVALKLMPTNIIGQATGLLILSAALLVLSKALISMGGMSIAEIAKSLIALGGALTIIAIAMNFMQTGLAGAAAMIIMAGALAILTPALVTLGNMSLSEIGKGLLALVGVFAVIGVAGLVLAPLVPVILSLSAAIALFGLGCLAVGVGVLAFSAGLTSLAVAGTAAAAAIVVMVTGLIGLIPYVLKTIAVGMIEVVKTIADGAPVIAEAVISILKSVINLIVTITPDLLKGIETLLFALLNTLLACVPKLVDAGMKLIYGILEGVARNIKQVTSAGIEVILQFIEGIASKIGDIVDTSFQVIISFINGLADAIENNYKAIYDAVRHLIRVIIDVIIGLIPEIIGVGEDIIKGLIKGIVNMGKALFDGIVNIIVTLINGVKDLLGIHSPSTVFAEIGSYMIEGMINGIKGMASKLIKAASGVVDSVVDGVKNLLGIHSPSRVFQDEVGAMIAIGMANGIDQNADKATNAAEKMSKGVYDTAKEWIDERKYYQQITLEDELYTWQQVQNQYAEGTADRIKADKEAHRVMKELYAAEYNSYVKNIDDRKYYGQMSLQEELQAWKAIQAKYREGTEERIKADKEVYRVEKELRTDNFDKEVGAIDDLKYYNKLSLKQELNEWEKIQAKYEEGSKERIKADKEVYRVKNELNSKWKELEDNYYSKSKDINTKLKQDIQSLNDEYNKAVDSRAQTLYNSYGLFDEVSKEQESVTGSQLFTNLKDQILAMSEWQNNLTSLSIRGVSNDLIKELEDLGVKSASKIKALNGLSNSELSEYVSLWEKKHAQAKDEAVYQLSDLKLETSNKIQDITAQSKIDLTTLREEWVKQMNLLETTSEQQLTTLNTVYDKKVETLTTDTKTKFVALSDDIQQIDWVGVGTNIVDGMIAGIKAKANDLYSVMTTVGLAALSATKLVLGIHSPSKAFAEIGEYSMMGFANGLNNFSDLASTEASNVGNSIMNALKNTISNISDVVNGNVDMNPTIRPVLDLTDVTTGSNAINSLLNRNAGITLSSASNKTSSIASNMRTANESQNSSTMVGQLKEILTTNPQLINVTVISKLDGREIARATAPAMSEELAYLNNRTDFAYGRG